MEEWSGTWEIGLRINWDNSVLLPLDPLPDALPLDASQLQTVSEFQYLGVKVNARPQDYIRLFRELLWGKSALGLR